MSSHFQLMPDEIRKPELSMIDICFNIYMYFEYFRDVWGSDKPVSSWDYERHKRIEEKLSSDDIEIIFDIEKGWRVKWKDGSIVSPSIFIRHYKRWLKSVDRIMKNE